MKPCRRMAEVGGWNGAWKEGEEKKLWAKRKRQETKGNGKKRVTEEGSWFRLCSRPRSMLLPWLQGQYRGALLLIIYVKDPSLPRSLERKLKREPP